MVTIIFLVAVCSMGIGVGLAYLMLAGIIRAERLRAEGYPIPVCAPNRQNALTGAYQDDTQDDDYEADLYAVGLADELDELERDAHDYRQEIQRLRDALRQAQEPLAEWRFPVAPVAATASRYSVVDRFAYLEIDQ